MTKPLGENEQVSQQQEKKEKKARQKERNKHWTQVTAKQINLPHATNEPPTSPTSQAPRNHWAPKPECWDDGAIGEDLPDDRMSSPRWLPNDRYPMALRGLSVSNFWIYALWPDRIHVSCWWDLYKWTCTLYFIIYPLYISYRFTHHTL